MRRAAAVVGLVVVLTSFAGWQLPREAEGAHHIAQITEVMSGFNGNPNIQFVEVTVGASQTLVQNTRLTAFNANGSANSVLLVVPSNISNSGEFIMGTAAFNTAVGGGFVDFTIPAGILADTGMVCWGAPGLIPPSPDTWSAKDVNQYVDCVAYGNFSGTTPNIPGGTNTPTGLGAGDCERSLSRAVATTFNAPNPPAGTWADTDSLNDFALAAPSPKNNAGATGVLGAATDTDADTMADCRDNDDDNDGIKDANDNCPLTASLDQTDGDGDGRGLPCDNDDADPDVDKDGCLDGAELGPNELAGGRRDPKNFWDVYDTPVGTPGQAGTTGRNGVINIGDVTRVIGRFGATDSNKAASPNRNDDPNATVLNAAPAYHPAYDRGAPSGKNPWNLSQADGVINIGDVTRVIAQFNTICA